MPSVRRPVALPAQRDIQGQTVTPAWTEAGTVRWVALMGLEVGGHHQEPDWPKLGPSLLIATCVILAIRTAKWPATFDQSNSEMDLDREIDFAAHLAGRVLSALVAKRPGLFPSKCVPWYQPSGEDAPK